MGAGAPPSWYVDASPKPETLQGPTHRIFILKVWSFVDSIFHSSLEDGAPLEIPSSWCRGFSGARPVPKLSRVSWCTLPQLCWLGVSVEVPLWMRHSLPRVSSSFLWLFVPTFLGYQASRCMPARDLYGLLVICSSGHSPLGSCIIPLPAHWHTTAQHTPVTI